MLPTSATSSKLVTALAVGSLLLSTAAGAQSAPGDEIVIEFDGSPDPGQEIVIEFDQPQGSGQEIVIEDPTSEEISPGGAADELLIDHGLAEPPPDTLAAQPPAEADQGRLRIGLDQAWLEYGHQLRADSRTRHSGYGRLTALANWQPDRSWELQLAGRVDGYSEDRDDSFSTIRGDYGDSFVRYHGSGFKLSLGSQTAIWGRMDEVPLSDRVSTADLTRFVLDDLEHRRRSTPMLRAETFVGGGRLDVAWLYDFRPAELPSQDSIWYPIDRSDGRVLGLSRDDIPAAVVRNARISEDAPDGDGGFGMRYTRSHSFADIGLTMARTRQSIPYFRADATGDLHAEYPRSWAFGADAALDALGATWRFEILYSSDNPVTRSDLRYTTTPALAWGGGIEMHPGDGDTRVSLQLIGTNLIDAPSILDRRESYFLNGEIQSPFDRGRWRAELDFNLGLDEKDIYLNPEIAFLGWEPHEVYLALHYFSGDEQTLGGFHEDHSSINLGWRTTF